ncbi:NAD(P)-binding protein [Parathielavia appendiculata]|uniref:NAD(P)-binding protein n=1 Tax=Parathielavia appendiculata TaxID=2587402 RepID=A0AAN6TUS2_9PEZI|nr:NAD(P)-binding protein [Parathielavia appendiculata]
MATRALVVGGTGGIGYAIACRIAAESKLSTVIISGRNKPQDIPHANIEFRPLDASSMRSIKQYTDAYKSAPEKDLNLLVLTQGIFSMAGRTETPEGIDRKMALHYYGRQLLIRELLPVMKDDAKVVIVLDGVRGGPPTKLNWDDLDLKTHYSLGNAANHCISMTDAMVQAYAAAQQKRRSAGRRHFVHAYPGFVQTNISNSLPWYLRPVARGVGHLFAVSPETCAAHMIRGTYECAAAVEKEGRFWSCIDDKGRLVARKPLWSEEQIKKVEEHTWKVLDDAINKTSS